MIDSKDKRIKLRLHKVMLLSRGSVVDRKPLIYQQGKLPKVKTTVLILTTITAFALGLSVGIVITFFVLPKISILPIDDARLTLVLNYSTKPESRQSDDIYITTFPLIENSSQSLENKNLSRPFSSVSFVPDMSTVVRSKVYLSTTPSPTVPSTTKETESLLNGIFWSDQVEKQLPRGFDEEDADCWRRFLLTAQVSKLERGCGRMQNRLITFNDGSRACVRYRQNTDQIQGELFSFYLGRALKVNNLAPCSLSVVRSSSPQWMNVRSQILLAQWSEDRPIIMTKFVENLRPANIPRQFRSNARRFHPADLKSDEQVQLSELVQWSDLIIFDYLTANLDRIVNNLYNLQWNPGMMEAPAHNLAKNTDNDLLLFLDNESGLLHGYRLLDKYEAYHSVLLESLCVFRKPTIDILERMRAKKNIGSILNENLFTFKDREILPVLPERSIKILNDRINKVLDQVSWCQRQYMDTSNEARSI